MAPQSYGGLLGFPSSRCDQCHFTGSPAHAVSCSMCAAPMFGIGDIYEGGDMLSASLAGVTLDSRTFDRTPMPTPNGAGQFGHSYQPAYASELGSNALLGMTGAWNSLGSGGVERSVGGGGVVVGGMKTFGSVVAAAAATHPVTSTPPVVGITTGSATPPPWSGIVGRPPYQDTEGGGGGETHEDTSSISAADAAAAAALALATATSARRPRCTNAPCIARGTHVTHTFGECRAEGGPIGGCVNPVCIAGNRARSHHWEEW